MTLKTIILTLAQSASRQRISTAIVAACPLLTVPLSGSKITLRSIFGSLMLSAFLLIPISSAQAAVVTSATGTTLGVGNTFAHAQAGGREALSLVYGSCSVSAERCLTGGSASATNDYFWNIVAQPGFESSVVPLNISYFLGVGSSNGGAALASMTVQGQKLASLSSTLGTKNQSGSVAILVNAGSQINIRLETSALNNGVNFFPPSPNWSTLIWALADPIVTIDPTWEFASSFSLEEVVNPMQFEAFGSKPVDLDLGEIPTELVGVVPVPAAAWLFGSALGLLGWMRRKRA